MLAKLRNLILLKPSCKTKNQFFIVWLKMLDLSVKAAKCKQQNMNLLNTFSVKWKKNIIGIIQKFLIQKKIEFNSQMKNYSMKLNCIANLCKFCDDGKTSFSIRKKIIFKMKCKSVTTQYILEPNSKICSILLPQFMWQLNTGCSILNQQK